MNTSYPPGVTNYSSILNDFIEAVELVANEIEASEEDSADLVTNLVTNYLKYLLENNIGGRYTKKCTNMPHGIDPGDYCTVNQALAKLGIPNISTIAPSTQYTVPASLLESFEKHSDYRVGTDGAIDEYRHITAIPPEPAGTPTYNYIDVLNKTYILDKSVITHNTFKFDSIADFTPVPVAGDRLNLIYLNHTNASVISAGTYKIMNTTSLTLPAGKSYINIGLTYLNISRGWFITNYLEV